MLKEAQACGHFGASRGCRGSPSSTISRIVGLSTVTHYYRRLRLPGVPGICFCLRFQSSNSSSVSVFLGGEDVHQETWVPYTRFVSQEEQITSDFWVAQTDLVSATGFQRYDDRRAFHSPPFSQKGLSVVNTVSSVMCTCSHHDRVVCPLCCAYTCRI